MRIKNNKALAKLVLEKSRQICKTLKNKERKRGRPPVYEDNLIVAALLIKVLVSSSRKSLTSQPFGTGSKSSIRTTLHS